MNLSKRIITSIILILILSLTFFDNRFLFIVLITTVLLSSYEFLNLMNKIFKKKRIIKYFFSLSFFIYILIFSIIIYYFFFNFNSKFLLLLILSICIFSDIGGLVFGKIFKGKKLTKISPNKTISGSVGSFLFSIICALLFANFNFINFNTGIFILVIATSFFCQLGDLFFSFLKRKAKIKDTGKILPGHGGILDRIDGILFGVPLGILFFILL